jgi:sugar lactone lactonase YvrE
VKAGVRRLAAGLGFPEAPLAVPDGTSYVSDVLGGGLHHLSAEGAVLDVLVPGRRGIGGAALDGRGDPIVTGRDVVVLPGGDPITLLPGVDGVTGYNDLGVTPDGHLVVGALTYRPLAGEPATPGRIYVIDPHGSSCCWDDGSTLWPNGMASSPGGEWLYVADFATGAVLRAPWPAEHATLRPWAVSPSGQADGMAVDSDGGVWVALGAGAGVARFHGNGELDDVLEVPSTFVSSVCFRLDGREILITAADDIADPAAGGCVFVAEVAHAGAPLSRAPTPHRDPT